MPSLCSGCHRLFVGCRLGLHAPPALLSYSIAATGPLSLFSNAATSADSAVSCLEFCTGGNKARAAMLLGAADHFHPARCKRTNNWNAVSSSSLHSCSFMVAGNANTILDSERSALPDISMACANDVNCHLVKLAVFQDMLHTQEIAIPDRHEILPSD